MLLSKTLRGSMQFWEDIRLFLTHVSVTVLVIVARN
jgi:hypothetical protein